MLGVHEDTNYYIHLRWEVSTATMDGNNPPSTPQFNHRKEGLWNHIHNVQDLPAAVFHCVVSSSPKCINSLRLILEGLQQGVLDAEWLIAATSTQGSETHFSVSQSMLDSNDLSRNVSILSRKSHWSGDTLAVVPNTNHSDWLQPMPQPTFEESVQSENHFGFLTDLPEHERHGTAQVINAFSHRSLSDGVAELGSPYQVSGHFTPGTDATSITNHWMIHSPPDGRFHPEDVIPTQQDLLRNMSSSFSFPEDDSHGYDPTQQVLQRIHPLQSSMQSPKATAQYEARNSSYQIRRTSKPCVWSDFNHYPGPQPTMYASRSPCPYPNCRKEFVSASEFSKHVTAEHDKPIEYICRHLLLSRRGKRCDFRNWSAPIYARHHTEHHGECKYHKLESSAPSVSRHCLRKQYTHRPKRVWGCWFCDWAASGDVDTWAKHHVEQHRGCDRKDMDKKWLIRSLLSQELLRGLSQQHVWQSVQKASHRSNSQWFTKPMDIACDELINQLETGFWGNRDYFIDLGAREAIVNAAIQVI